VTAARVPAGVGVAGRRGRGEGARLSVAVARLPAFLALAGFGAYRWADMVSPGAGGSMTAALTAALAAGLALIAVGRREPARARRIAAIALAAVLLLLVALLAAGLSLRLAGPRAWDELAAGIGQGLSAVPNVRVPYAGVDEWIRTVMVLGGTLLVGFGALLAFVPRRGGAIGYPFAAAVVLGVLYLVPAMQRDTPNQFLAGGVFTALLVGFLWLDRVERRSAPLAAGVVSVALLVALLAGPGLDRDVPLIDYETLAQSLSSGPSARYDWNHAYGPLDWSRDGREVLRVRARDRAYWKAANLAQFDGVRWSEARGEGQGDLEGALQSLHPRWRQTLQVTVRALNSTQFVAAGTTLDIIRPPRTAVMQQPGVYSTAGRPLRRGNAYRADVYAPRPTARELRDAHPPRDGTAGSGMTSVALPGRPDDRVVIPPWGEGPPSPSAIAALRSTAYARAYDLAARLRDEAATQYDYVRAVEEHLANGFSYSEDPPPSAVPLADFLFESRVGYCQHFSGAMALLLRLGGVPARVAAGFSPGAYDAGRREYVVRDIDAHSWVEVYFDNIGWVTRDPTPPAAPARAQFGDSAAASDGLPARRPDAGALPPARFEPETPSGAGGGTLPQADERSPWPVVGAAVAALLAALAVLLAIRARRRRPDDAAGERQLAELRRALARSGRPPAPQTTLEGLAERWRGTPAEAYVRVLAGARYGYGQARPTDAQRAALRRELSVGLGLRGRMRAWWALPPRPPSRRRREHAG
jgi:transglutaminase-like putative cysteine protease